MNWTSRYDMSGKFPMQGDVFGNWDEKAKMMTQGFGA